MKQETLKHLTPGWNDKIRAAAAERNITMTDIKEKFGVVLETVSKVFRGSNDASFELAFQISEYLATPFLVNRKNQVSRRLIYVGSPYSGNVQENIEINKSYCRDIIAEGLLPMSPHCALAFLDEDTERETALKFCKNLIDICDEVRLYIEFGKSEGMKMEEAYARERGKLVVFMS